MGPARKQNDGADDSWGLEIGDRIQQAMEQKNIDNRTLARLCDVGERAVSQWKRDGKVSREKLPLLANALSVSVDYILGVSKAEDTTKVDDDNLIAFEPRINKVEHDGVRNVQLRRQNIVYAPVIEYEEIVDQLQRDPARIAKLLTAFTEEQDSRAIIPYMLNADKGIDGAPQFFIQLLEQTFEPYFHKGDLLGVTTTWYPWRGALCLFAVRDTAWSQKSNEPHFRLVIGYYFPVNNRIDLADIGGHFDNNWNYKLKVSRDHESPDDVHITPDIQAYFIGMVTLSMRWEMPTLAARHTSLIERQESVMERAIRPFNVNLQYRDHPSTPKKTD